MLYFSEPAVNAGHVAVLCEAASERSRALSEGENEKFEYSVAACLWFVGVPQRFVAYLNGILNILTAVL